ncbi:PREDICTED: oil body-associated protein 2B isoform X1 [Tarenaya hassleriana]|uniref:oil body-associated protein 2B isoform X1 n=1 Tax=Tarenaya hassleriana TaxID=28532 RepID=UPI00053C30D7|nr:PREDICTED: oil body-associated protein 2B isoform X1 [Tarenaya hassleriana]
MASSDKVPGACPARNGDKKIPPGDPMAATTVMLDKGTAMMQSLKPIKQMSQHLCSFALHSHDPSRQIEAHFYVQRVNQDFLQSAVYDSNSSSAHLIGVEYMVSEKLFNTLPPEEQKLWHSHQYELSFAGSDRSPSHSKGSGACRHARTPKHCQNLRQVLVHVADRPRVNISGDRLPLGPPALMMSPQDVNMGRIKPELVKKRDDAYGISTESILTTRGSITGPEVKNPNADYWVEHGKGFAIDIVETDMKKTAP